MAVTPIGTIGGEGHWLLAISWATTGAAAVCFLLRLYTRLAVVKSYGWDDTIYNASFVSKDSGLKASSPADSHAIIPVQVLLLVCTIMVHVSTLYGLGQSQDAIWEDSHERLTKCLLYLVIAQIFGVSTMGTAKVSLGLLLLRLVTKRWHRWTIWTAIALLFVDTAICALAFAFQCTPPAFLWDKTISGGRCSLPITPFAIALGTGCVAADLFFAIFPWFFVWQLNRPFQERLIIAIAMSLGLAAAACGVKRTIGLGGLQSANYTTDAVPTCAWSIAELAITLVCIAIPVCLPLFKKLHGHAAFPATSSAVGSGREKAGPGGVFALRTFGGSSMPKSDPSKSWPRNSQTRDVTGNELLLGRFPSEDIDNIACQRNNRPKSRSQECHGSDDIERQIPVGSVGR